MAPPTTTGTIPAARTGQRTLTLPAGKREVASARRFIEQVLGPEHPCADVAVLLTSELVANAVVHSDSRHGGSVTVAVSRLSGWLQIEVTDAGSANSTPTVKRSASTCSGHGLFLVDTLAHEWGYCTSRGQTTVWFSLLE